MQKFPVRAATAAAVIALALPGCSAGKSAPPPRPSPATAVATAAPVTSGDPHTEKSSKQPSEEMIEPLRLTGPWMDGPPRGDATQIALRFVQALQRGDDRAAVRELSLVGRSYFALRDNAVLHRVMRDVAAHAELSDAGGCTRADRLTREAAVVRCGRANIIVHVLDDQWTRGVQLAAWHLRPDVFDGPHTHAFTTVML
jgi:hypothetical protein